MTTPAREKILDAAAGLIHRQGFHHTGIQQILQAAGVPKGSFYFYFKSKQDLGLAIIDHFGQFWMAKAEEIMGGSTAPPLERLRAFFAFFRDYFAGQGCQGGCPVGNLGQEMGDVSPALGRRLSQAIDAMARRVAVELEEAQARGDLAPGADPLDLAYFVISSWQGALIRMKVCKCLEPLITFEEVVFGRVLAT